MCEKSKLGTDKHEEAGIGAIGNYFSIYPAVDTTFLKKGDRSPEWDGDLFLYKDGNRNNVNLIGRIPVQAKGVSVDEFTNECKYSIPISSLKNYLQDGGLIFFVAQFTPTSRERKLFYKRLLPVDIKKILSESKGDKTCTITLEIVPDNVEHFKPILRSFIDDKKCQSSIIDSTRFFTFEELKSKGFTKRFSNYGLTLEDIHSIFDISKKNAYYEYAMNESIGIVLPVGDGPKFSPVTELKSEGETCLKVGNKEFKMPYRRIETESELKVLLGDSFCIVTPKDKEGKYTFGQGGETQYKFVETTLSKKIEDLEFLLQLLEHNKLLVWGTKIELMGNPPSINFRNNVENSLSRAYMIKELLSALTIEKDLVTKDLNEEDYENLDILYRALVLNEKLSLDIEGIQPCFLKISNLLIFVCFYKDPEDGLTRCIDFFDPKNFTVLEQYDLYFNHISPYNFFLSYAPFWPDNIPTENVAASYKEYEGAYKYLREQARYDVLELTKNAVSNTVSISMREKMLKVGLDVLDWLLKKEDNQYDYNFSMTLKLQINKILNIFTDEDKINAMRIALDPMGEPILKAIGWLLLDKRKEFNDSFEKLISLDKDELIKWPIYKLTCE